MTSFLFREVNSGMYAPPAHRTPRLACCLRLCALFGHAAAAICQNTLLLVLLACRAFPCLHAGLASACGFCLVA